MGFKSHFVRELLHCCSMGLRKSRKSQSSPGHFHPHPPYHIVRTPIGCKPLPGSDRPPSRNRSPSAGHPLIVRLTPTGDHPRLRLRNPTLLRHHPVHERIQDIVRTASTTTIPI